MLTAPAPGLAFRVLNILYGNRRPGGRKTRLRRIDTRGRLLREGQSAVPGARAHGACPQPRAQRPRTRMTVPEGPRFSGKAVTCGLLAARSQRPRDSAECEGSGLRPQAGCCVLGAPPCASRGSRRHPLPETLGEREAPPCTCQVQASSVGHASSARTEHGVCGDG